MAKVNLLTLRDQDSKWIRQRPTPRRGGPDSGLSVARPAVSSRMGVVGGTQEGTGACPHQSPLLPGPRRQGRGGKEAAASPGATLEEDLGRSSHWAWRPRSMGRRAGWYHVDLGDPTPEEEGGGLEREATLSSPLWWVGLGIGTRCPPKVTKQDRGLGEVLGGRAEGGGSRVGPGPPTRKSTVA